jgi:hypothetical protein
VQLVRLHSHCRVLLLRLPWAMSHHDLLLLLLLRGVGLRWAHRPWVAAY